MNASDALNRPKTLEVDGTEYQLYGLDLNDLADFEMYANTLLVGQFEGLWRSLAPLALNIEHLKYVTQLAADRTMKYFEFGSPELNQMMLALVGQRELLYLSVRHGKPEFTRADAAKLFGRMTRPQAERVLLLTGLFTDDKAEAAGESPDPKDGRTPGDSAIPADGAVLAGTT